MKRNTIEVPLDGIWVQDLVKMILQVYFMSLMSEFDLYAGSVNSQFRSSFALACCFTISWILHVSDINRTIHEVMISSIEAYLHSPTKQYYT